MNVPEHLAYLTDDAAASFLTAAVMEERDVLPFAAIDRLSVATTWAAGPVRELLDEAMKRFGRESRTSADAWLAPVLHASLRLTRREAADSGLWNHLALRVAPDYVVWRHPPKAVRGRQTPAVNRRRFSGPFHSQTFARLWWAAELFRDGPDYAPVVVGCRNQDMLNTALRLEVVLHRPTAQAMLRLLAAGTIHAGREVNALAQAVNAAGSTLMYEALALDSAPDPDAYQDWIDELPSALVPYDALPHGPADGRVRESAVRTLLPLFEELFAGAPVRGRSPIEEKGE